MRNPLALIRRQPDAARPTLKARAAALRATAAKVLRRPAAVAEPATTEPTPAAPVDRVALVNYATWLHFERKRVCTELYPHQGVQAHRYVISNTAADRWHFPDGGFEKSRVESPEPASARAARILDMLGVDWRADTAENRRRHLDPASSQDTGERPALPHGGLTADAGLIDALGDLTRVRRAIAALLDGDQRDATDVLGFDALAEARDEALDRLTVPRAESLTGLQAKAAALACDDINKDNDLSDEIGRSLARDLLEATGGGISPKPDPVYAVIEESERLFKAWSAALELPPTPGRAELETVSQAQDAFNRHNSDVLLTTVPRTARGCKALAGYVRGHYAADRFVIDENEHSDANFRVLDLIARSPLF